MRTTTTTLALLVALFSSVACGSAGDAPAPFESSGEETPRKPADKKTTTDGTTTTTPATTPAQTPEVAPSITSISPDAITVGLVGPEGLDVTIEGSHFAQGAVVKIGGVALQATANAENSLVVRITADKLRTPGELRLVVSNPSGLASNELSLTVANPSTIAISRLTPNNAVALGTAAVSIGLLGSGFTPGSVVRFNGGTLQTTFTNGNSISATLPADALQTAGRFGITVANGSDIISLPSTFEVRNPVPTLRAFAPTRVAVGSAAVLVTMDGTNFMPNSELTLNGSPLATTYVSSTRVRAVIPASSMTVAQTLRLQVVSPTPGGGVSPQTANFGVL